jgi:PilZ domain
VWGRRTKAAQDVTTADIAADIKRRASRASLFLTANIAIEGLATPVTVRVRNLSEGGMMIDGHVKLVQNMPVIVDLRGIGKIEGRVAWTEAGRAGVAFAVEIDPKLARAPSPTGMALETTILKAPPIYERRPGLRPR